MNKNIEQWASDDSISLDHVTLGYEWLGDNTLGITRFRWYEDEQGADIRISPPLRRHPLLECGVQWHEYNHYAEWVIYGTTGHGANWLRLRARRPLLLI